MKFFTTKYYVLAAAAILFSAAALSLPLISNAAFGGPSASGQGTLPTENTRGQRSKRQFSFSAHANGDGTVTGNAVLHNPAFTGENGQPYMLQIDVQCLKVVGNTAFMGGTTKRTNDPSLVDAVYFAVQDNGEPGAGVDKISRVLFFDDDPATTGDPQLCQGNVITDFVMEPIERGNVSVRGGE